MEYSEHDGTNRQLMGNNGEKKYLYILMSNIRILLTYKP